MRTVNTRQLRPRGSHSRWNRIRAARFLMLLLLMAIAGLVLGSLPRPAELHAATLDFTGTWNWTDTTSTGGVFRCVVTLNENVATGALTWNCPGGHGGGSVSGTSFTATIQESCCTATFNGSISGDGQTLTGSWTQSDGQFGTFIATRLSGPPGRHLAFVVQPANAQLSATLTPPVKVAVEDAQGQTDASATDAITLALASNPGGATLKGTVTVAASGGVATFSNLSLDKAGQGYTLSASDGNSAVTGATSTAFSIFACAAATSASAGTSSLCLTKDGSVTAAGAFSYKLTLQNGSTTQLTNVKVDDQVTPAFNLQTPAVPFGSPAATTVTWPAAAGSNAQPGTLDWTGLSVAPGASLPISYTLQPAAVTAPDGQTLSAQGWTADGWVATSQTTPAITRNGDGLIYSDRPEFLEVGKTIVSATGAGLDDNMEGVLYHQPYGFFSSGSFRLYLNHENRTGVAKALYYLVANAGNTPVTLTAGATGLGNKPGDPVISGQAALLQYFQGGGPSAIRLKTNNSCTGTAALVTIAGGASCVFFIHGLAAKGSGANAAADVVNLIEDLHANGNVQIGVVVVNANTSTAFESAPHAYTFGGTVPGPAGGPTRTYAQNGQLDNPTEAAGHVRGTFPYNEVDVKLTYDLGSGNRYGWRLGDCSPSICPGNAGSKLSDQAFQLEYAPASDTFNPVVGPPHTVYNVGNFGVLYKITVTLQNAKPGMAAQVLLNPRAVSPADATHTANAFAGVITTTIHSGPFAVPLTGNIQSNTQAIGAGFLRDSSDFTMQLIPPAGDSLPVAVVLAPAYVRNTVVVTTSDGATTQQEKILTFPDPGQ